MKIKATIILTLLAVQLIQAQNAGFYWAKHMGGGGGSSGGHGIVTDAAGNVYTTGFFQGGVDFDPGAGDYTLHSGSNGDSFDAFICKFDPEGNLIWAKQFGSGITGTGKASGYSIALDKSGNVYTTGSIDGTVDFDPGNNSYNLTGIGSYIAKLDAGGNFVWAKQMETLMVYEYGNLIVTDNAGNVYTTGSFTYGVAVDFDPGAGTYILNSLSRKSVFISKLDAAGNFVWVKQIGGATGTDEASGSSLTLDVSGNILITGSFGGTADFDPGTGVFNLTSNSVANIFVAKLDPSGNFTWAKQMKGSGNSAGISIATDATGNVFTTGFFAGAVDFDPGAGVTNFRTNGGDDIFISKLDPNGNMQWAQQIGGAGFDVGYSIAIDAAQDAVITGNFNGNDNIDSSTCVVNKVEANNGYFLSKISAGGTLLWTRQMGGDGYSTGGALTIDVFGNICSTGTFHGEVDFNPGYDMYNLFSDGIYDIVVHKMIPCASTTFSNFSITTCHDYTLNCKTYTSSGVYTQTILNSGGCDSVITLNLTISASGSTVTIDTVVCGSYLFNGQLLTSSGIYKDTVVDPQGCNAVITLNLTIKPASSSNIIHSICEGESYLGYNKSGIYTDTLVAFNGCDSIRKLQLTVLQKPKPDLGPNTGLCNGNTITLYPGQFSSYLWQDGSTQPSFTAKNTGTYSVQVTNICGTGLSQISIAKKICDIVFPSAFTPNDDSKNDIFKILDAPPLNNYHLVIYNRWGQKIFETTDYTKGWDGRTHGQLSPTGTYVWSCSFVRSDIPGLVEMKGEVILLR